MAVMNDYVSGTILALKAAGRCSYSRLFEPFDPRKWFLLGLSAWLTVIYKISNNFVQIVHMGNEHLSSLVSLKELRKMKTNPDVLKKEVLSWMAEHVVLILIILTVFLVLTLFLLWLSSVAEFIFLDNVSRNTVRINSSVKKFYRRGTSLFLWRLLIYFMLFLVTLGLVVLSIAYFAFSITNGGDQAVARIVSSFLLIFIGIVTILLFIAFIRVFIADFIVPFMYKFDLTLLPAAKYSLKLLRVHWLGIAIFWFTKEILGFLVKLILITAICCTLFLVLAPYGIPVIGIGWHYLITVLLLPIYIFFRAFGPSFLEQLNPAYQMID